MSDGPAAQGPRNDSSCIFGRVLDGLLALAAIAGGGRPATVRRLSIWVPLSVSLVAGLVFAAITASFRNYHYAPGADFAIFWTAGHLIAEGRALDVFDPPKFMAAAHRLIDPRLPLHFWSYPPTALLNVAWLGRLPYVPALIAWNVAGLVLVLTSARWFFSGWRTALLLMLSPAVIANLADGQNGFLTTALILAGMAALQRREGLAGALFGLLGFKPQLGILLPVAMIAGRRWRTIMTAGAVGLGVAALATAIFGMGAWEAFLRHTLPAQTAMMQGTGPIRWLAPTAFMSGVILFGPGMGPWLVQAPFTVLGVMLAWRAFGSRGDWRMKAAALATATAVASPQGFGYDLVPVAAAGLVLVRAEGNTLDDAAALVLWSAPILVVLLYITRAPATPVLLALAALRIDHRLRTPARTEQLPSRSPGPVEAVQPGK
jgi:hypothetical protein